MPDHHFVPAPGAAAADTTDAPDDGVVTVRRWSEPGRDDRGFDCRSRYVERFWLGVLGPSATWLLRRLNDELDRAALEGRDTARVDLVALARRMGMTYVPGRSSAFARAIQRCVMFDMAHHTADGLAVRRRVPTVAERHLRRLPPDVAKEHDRWTAAVAQEAGVDRRARIVARAMAAAGDCIDQVASQLVAIGVDPATADDVVTELRALDASVA